MQYAPTTHFSLWFIFQLKFSEGYHSLWSIGSLALRFYSVFFGCDTVCVACVGIKIVCCLESLPWQTQEQRKFGIVWGMRHKIQCVRPTQNNPHKCLCMTIGLSSIVCVYSSRYVWFVNSLTHPPIPCPVLPNNQCWVREQQHSLTHARTHTHQIIRCIRIAGEHPSHTPNIQIHDVYLTQRVAMCTLYLYVQ